MSDDLVKVWDDLKDNMPESHADAAEAMHDLGDKMADRIEKLEARILADADRIEQLVATCKALEAERQEAREEALREAAAMLQLPENGTAGAPQDQVDRLIDEDRRMIRRAILALIPADQEGDE